MSRIVTCINENVIGEFKVRINLIEMYDLGWKKLVTTRRGMMLRRGNLKLIHSILNTLYYKVFNMHDFNLAATPVETNLD
jgi:hypothetical protein